MSRFGPLLLAVALLLVAWLAGGGRCERAGREDPGSIRLTGTAFGTIWSVVFVPAAGSPPQTEESLRATIGSVLDRVDSLMSTFSEESDIVRFNESRMDTPFELDPETGRVVRAALDLARDTGGAFDPTVAPLVGMWGFGAKASEGYPSDEDIEQARARVGWSLLAWDGEGRLTRKAPSVQLDLSGIAKGYGVDAVVRALAVYRPAGMMVEIGGDLRVTGTRPGREPWRLGIQSPEGGLDAALQLTDTALATSGDYRQRHGEGDERRSHIIDPRTGRPANTDVASASVLAPTTLEADAVATAIVVTGAKEAMAYVEARPWLEAMIITRRPGEDEILGSRASSGWPIK